MQQTLRFHSFDGGGPSFTAVIENPEILSCAQTAEYARTDHKFLCGAGFDAVFTLTGQSPGETNLRIEARSPIVESVDHLYRITVDSAMQVTVTHLGDRFPERPLRLMLGGTELPVTWEDNDAVNALRTLRPPEIPLTPYGGFEQFGPIGQSLPHRDRRITAQPGDIMLYCGDQIVLFTGSNTWQYTRLGPLALDADTLNGLLGGTGLVLTFPED